MIAKIELEGAQRWVVKRDGDVFLCPEGLSNAQLLSGDFAPGAKLADDIPLSFLPPILPGARIFCVGKNYQAHSIEMGGEAPADPMMFTRFDESFVGHHGTIAHAGISEEHDYEGELVAVLGSGGRHLDLATAAEALSGLTLAVDGSIRDFQKHSLFAGKNFEQSGALGPWIVPASGASDLSAITLETEIDGELRQTGCPRDFIHPLPKIIAYLSRVLTLRAGDMISTGSPAGVGAGFDPPRWLKRGNAIKVRATGLEPLEVRVT